ncbi:MULTISPECIES: ATP-binding protein [Methylobacterium]|uniref:ATP-binding protein n=1 Tax=Methylobacterium TaxID=407 RepID=UPI0013EE35FA|nr:AAA family ATPase [Methylobacterium sp. DB0501]NGM33335.1 AAA family ATPase [Methylobacterium sp. DB0501]
MERSFGKTDGPRERAQFGERREARHGGARQAEPPQPIELHWHGEADPNADRAWLIRHLVFETGKGLVAGQWGAGKTFGVLDMSGSVMTGEPFAGRKVMRTGGVLFIAPEGAFEIPVRLRGVVEGKLRGASMARAAAGGSPIDPDNLPFVWIEECPPLTKAGSLDRLIATAKTAAAEMDRRFGVPIVLVVIDTVAAGAGFEDENSASETQKVMDAMGALSRETGAFVLGVDHFGKVSETGTRGSSAKEAAADVVLAMLATRSEAGEISNTRMAVRKVRGARSGYEIPYNLEVVTLGVDQDDEPVTTCIVTWQTQAEQAPQPTKAKERWPQSLRVFRTALSTVLIDDGKDAWPFGSEGPKVLAARVSALRDEFCRAYPVSGETAEKQADAKRKGFARALKAAMDRGLIATREIGGVDHVWQVPDGQE